MARVQVAELARVRFQVLVRAWVAEQDSERVREMVGGWVLVGVAGGLVQVMDQDLDKS